MQYLKLMLIVAVVIVTSLFLVQNLGQLDRPLSLGLDLFFKKLEFRPVPIFALVIGGFVFGMLLACAVGLLERLRLTRTLRRQRKTITALEWEVRSLRNLPLAEADFSASSPAVESARRKPEGLPSSTGA